MKYGSLEWANDLLEHAKAELDKIRAADEKGKAAAEGLGLTKYYTNLIKSLEDEISKGNYKPEDSFDNEELDTTDADSINIADFEDEIKESSGDVDKIVERIIDLSETTDMSSDDIKYMRNVLTQKVKDYLKGKEPESTNLSGIAKALDANDFGRSL